MKNGTSPIIVIILFFSLSAQKHQKSLLSTEVHKNSNGWEIISSLSIFLNVSLIQVVECILRKYAEKKERCAKHQKNLKVNRWLRKNKRRRKKVWNKDEVGKAK